MPAAEEKPVDHNNRVYVIFYWLGIGTLLPWNFFISVTGYWDYKFRTVLDGVKQGENVEDVPGRNEMQTEWGSQLAAASMVPNVTVLLLNAAFGHHFKTTPRLLISLILVIVLFAFTSVMTVVDTDQWQWNFKMITLASVVLININSAIFQGGLLGLAGKFPPEYIGGVFSGQALGGIFASATNVVILALGADPVIAAFGCFVTAVLFLASALAMFFVVTKSDFFKYYLNEGGSGDGAVDSDSIKMDRDSLKAGSGIESRAADPVEAETTKFLADTPAVDVRRPYAKAKPNPLAVLVRIAPYAISIFLLFLVTLTCFPAVVALVVSTGYGEGGRWHRDFFVPVTVFLLFNVGDYLSRVLAEKVQWPKPGRFGMVFVFIASVLRLSFIPLFIFCNVNPTGRNVTSVAFESDSVFIALMLLFSTSNGYLANICMMSAPQVAGENPQTAASIMVALLGLGLGSGAILSYPAVQLL